MAKTNHKQLTDELEQAYLSYQKLMTTHAFFKVHSTEVSEDLVQSTFMKTWAYLAKGGKIELMKAFLYRILNDLIIDEYRKRKDSSLDTLMESGMDFKSRDFQGMDNIIDAKSAAGLIRFLPVKYRKIIQLKYIDELSLKEIATVTGQKISTVTVQVFRGMEKLRVLYIN